MDQKERFLSLLILVKERKREAIGIHPNTIFEAAYLVIWCTPKLAHLKIFKAFREGMKSN